MFAAGYSTKMAKENEQDFFAYQDCAECDEFAFDGLKSKVGSGSVEFKCHVFQFQVSG